MGKSGGRLQLLSSCQAIVSGFPLVSFGENASEPASIRIAKEKIDTASIDCAQSVFTMPTNRF